MFRLIIFILSEILASCIVLLFNPKKQNEVYVYVCTDVMYVCFGLFGALH